MLYKLMKFYFAIFLTWCFISSSCGTRFLNFFVSRRAQNGKSEGSAFSDSPFVVFDEYGSMPAFEDTFKLVESSSPIIIIMGHNFTLVAQRQDPSKNVGNITFLTEVIIQK